MSNGIDANFNQNEGIFTSKSHTTSSIFETGEPTAEPPAPVTRTRVPLRYIGIGAALGVVAWLIWRQR